MDRSRLASGAEEAPREAARRVLAASESDVESSSSRKKKARRDPSVAPVAASSAAPATGRRSRRGDDQGESSSAGPSAPSALSAAADFAPETIMHPKIRPRPIDVKKEMRLGYFEDADPVQRLEYYTFQDANSASAAPGLERSREITCPNFKDVPDFEELNRDRRYLARETQRFCPYHPPADDEFVDYDADADDVAFLESLPGNAGRKKVTELVFEQLIDTFERASYDFTTFLNDPASIRFQRDAAAKKEEAQRSPQTPQCQVCNDNENHDGNIVVVCSKCNVPVHQSCYGISEDIDRNQPWVCDRCALPDPDKVSCAMCSVKTGAFKETTTPGEYAHVLCALWFPEARFVNPERMQPIEINQRAFQRRKRLGSCCVCGKAEGVCLQCCEKPCPEAFHAMCARLKGLLLTMTEREEGQNQVLFRAFCEKHTNERKAAEPREAVPQRTRMGEPVSLFMARQIATTMLQNRQVSLPPGSVQAIYEYWVRKRQAQACSFLRRFQPCKAFQYLPGEKRGQTVRSWTSKLNDMDPHAPPLRNAAGRFVSANADGRSPTPQSFTRRGRGQQLHTGDEDDSKPPAPRGRRRAAAAEGAEGQEPSPGVEGPDDEDEGAVAASPFLIKDEEDFADAKRIKILLDRERVLIDLVINREKKKAAFALTAFRIAVQQSEESERAMRIAKRRIAQESG
eukprot:tig00000826_g4578.t1